MSTKFSETVYQCLKTIQYTLLPGICILCRRTASRDRDLCIQCENTFNRIARPCRCCGLSLPPGYTGTTCGTCMALPPPYSRLVAPFAYSPPVSGLIARYKYHGKLVNGRVLTELLAIHLKQVYRQPSMPDFLLPMPLHRRRLGSRGFNQAREISRRLSRVFAIPELARTLQRVRATEHQTGLSANQRQRNIRGAFRLKPGPAFPEGASVALIDDVVTTGATVHEVARLLKKAGAEEVHVWTLARTEL